MTPARTLPQTVLIAAATVLTATLYGAFFSGRAYLPPLIAVALVSAALAVAAAAARLPGLPTVIAGAVGFGLTAVSAVLTSTLRDGIPTALTFREGWRALSGGWAAMLSIAAPAPATPQLLMTPALITWVAGFLAVTLALRTRNVLGPAAILVCAQAAGLMFAANQASTHLTQTCGLLVLLLVLTLIRARGPAGDPGRLIGARLALVVAVAGTGVLGALASTSVDAAQRFNPRALLTPPLHLDQTLSPLSEVRAQLRLDSPRDLFTITISGAPDPVDLIQTVALDSFDGLEWTSSDSFRVAGPVLAPDQAAPGAVTLTERVTVRALPGPYLPVAGQPARIDASFGPGGLVGFSPASGTLVADAASLTGGSYTVVADGQSAVADLANAAAGSGASFAPYTALRGVPAPLAALARRITAGASAPYAKLVAIDDYLRRLPVSLNAPPGDSYGALLRMLGLGVQREPGYADQHAAAFAVLARIERLPTRVMVGYRLPASRLPASQGSGRGFVVSTADAYAWAQAYLQGCGWINFDPTNTADTAVISRAVTAPVQPARPSPVVKRGSRPATGTGSTRSGSRRSDGTPASRARPGTTSSLTSPQVLIPVLAAGLCAAVAGMTAGKRLQRRRRRRQGEPPMRVIGAWEEAVDRLADAGVRFDGSQTPLELAGRAAYRGTGPAAGGQRVLALVAPYLGALAAMTTEAAFSDNPVSAEDTESAWLLEAQIGKALYRGRRAAYRAAHWTVPAPLLRTARRT
jgi:transglutaminase-like putative cysteine protease